MAIDIQFNPKSGEIQFLIQNDAPCHSFLIKDADGKDVKMGITNKDHFEMSMGGLEPGTYKIVASDEVELVIKQIDWSNNQMKS